MHKFWESINTYVAKNINIFFALGVIFLLLTDDGPPSGT